VLKKAKNDGVDEADDEAAVPPGWAWDRSRRHDYRYWDGHEWTDRVIDGGDEGCDEHLPLGQPVSTSPTPGGEPADPPTSEPLTIKTFFEADPRRRDCKGVTFGDQWRSADDPKAEFHLYWLETTGECYLMRVGPSTGERPKLLDTDDSGGGFVGVLLGYALGQLAWERHHRQGHHALEVEVLARGLSRQEVEERLHGWQAAMTDRNSLDWLRKQLVR